MSLRYDLQFFAKDGPGGEKTEPATAKKLSDARKKGQVAKSREVNNAATLLALFAFLGWLVAYYGSNFLDLFSMIYGRIPELSILYNGEFPYATIYGTFRFVITRFLMIILPALLIGFIVPFVSNLVQVKWKPTTEPMKPKFTKLNPINGIKRIFSVNSLMELLKSILKIGLIGLIGLIVFLYLRQQQNNLLILIDLPILNALRMLSGMIVNVGIRIAVIYIFIGLGDFLFQKWKFSEDMKMTKQEVKDEYKNTEGDPAIKAKQRQRMMEASRRRMMQQLPQADVVITNPTHYAVAIKYDPDKHEAPYVVAKGCDYLAARIREIARENHIEIVENKPLARMLYANVEVDQLVPPELYQAVEEVLAFVYHLQGRY